MTNDVSTYGLWVLVVMYRRLALREERDVAADFGEAYQRYAEGVPRFIPHLSNWQERRT